MFCCRWYLDNKINEICICFLTSRINNNLLVWVGEQQLDRLNGYAIKFKSVHIAGWAQHSFLISASCGWAWTFKIRILLTFGVESFPSPFSTIHPLRSWISGSDTTNCAAQWRTSWVILLYVDFCFLAGFSTFPYPWVNWLSLHLYVFLPFCYAFLHLKVLWTCHVLATGTEVGSIMPSLLSWSFHSTGRGNQYTGETNIKQIWK